MPFDEVTWDAASWLGRFTAASRMKDSAVLRELPASVFLGTAGIVRDRCYAIDSVQSGLDHDEHNVRRPGSTNGDFIPFAWDFGRWPSRVRPCCIEPGSELLRIFLFAGPETPAVCETSLF